MGCKDYKDKNIWVGGKNSVPLFSFRLFFGICVSNEKLVENNSVSLKIADIYRPKCNQIQI